MAEVMRNMAALDRRAAIGALLAGRRDMLVVTGLGSTSWDAASCGDDDRNFYLWGAMGAAAMVGLGLALAQPQRRVLVVTGDGEMLMGLGALATIGAAHPANLAIAVFDNGRYGETGMQRSHTDACVALAGVARACGFAEISDLAAADALEAFARRLSEPGGPLFARVAITAAETPRVLPPRNGVLLKTRFRRALGIETS